MCCGAHEAAGDPTEPGLGVLNPLAKNAAHLKLPGK